MKTYVIADLHGRLDLMEAALSEIYSRDPGTIIFTGDFIDRGPDSAGVVQTVIDGPKHMGWRWRAIRGNHEDMAIAGFSGDDRLFDWWLSHGGLETIKSYGGEVPQEHLDWFASLPRLIVDRHRVYVHASICEKAPLGEQPEEFTQWYRYPKGVDANYSGRHIVHGHTPMKKGPELLPGRTNLDTGSCFTGRIVVGVFDDDLAGGPVELIDVTTERVEVKQVETAETSVTLG